MKKLLVITSVFIVVYSYFGTQNLQNLLFYYKNLAPFLYLVIWSFLPLCFFPVSVLSTLGGVIFGFEMGFILSILGVFFNSYISYHAPLYLSAKFCEKIKKNSTKVLKNFTRSNQFFSVIMLRLVPIIPYILVNYTAGILKFNLRGFLLASVIGKIPTTLIYINFGQNALDFGTAEFYFSLFWLGVLFVISLILKKLLA